MLEKIKKIFKPENMMFRMAALNCGLLLLVTVVITGTGNVIYQNSIEESSYANTMESGIEGSGSDFPVCF